MIWDPYFIKNGKVHLMQKVSVINSGFLVLGACGESHEVGSISWGDPDLPEDAACGKCEDVYIVLLEKFFKS